MPLKAAVVGIVGTSTVLSKHGLDGKVKELIMKLLPKIPRHDAKMSYEYPPEGVDFHYIVEKSIIYMVANTREDGNDSSERRIPFFYLDDVKSKFRETFAGSADKYPTLDTLSENDCAKFNRTLDERMRWVMENDQITLAKKNIADVQDVMVKNIESVIERGEKIEDLVTTADGLNSEAVTFKKKSNKLKNKMKWRDRRFAMAIGAVLLIIILIIVIYFSASS